MVCVQTLPVINDSLPTGCTSEIDEEEVPSWRDKSETIIIFDWDDTLCPSSWISANRPALSYFRTPPNEKCFVEPLDRLQNAVVQLLEVAETLGKVVIITNAKESWVTTSCTNFLPKVLPQLASISQVYARDTWTMWETDEVRIRVQANAALCADDRPDCRNSTDYVERLSQVGVQLFPPHSDFEDEEPSLLWKVLAFGLEIKDFYSARPNQELSNVVSIGDADFERIATKTAVNSCSPGKSKRAKTVKLLDDPTIEEIILQLEKLITILPFVVRHNESVDLEIAKSDLPSYD